VRVSSWNVNSIRNVSKRQLLFGYLERCRPDWLCINELDFNYGVYPRQLKALRIPKDYFWYLNCWSKSLGVMVLTPHAPLRVLKDMPGAEGRDMRGRVIALEYSSFYLVGVDKPNIGYDKGRLEFKTRQFDPAFNSYVSALREHKELVICGDMNVAHRDIDLADPEQKGSTGCTPEERQSFSDLLACGFVDTFRMLSP
jgi:exodeoxyribonuclease III